MKRIISEVRKIFKWRIMLYELTNFNNEIISSHFFFGYIEK